MFANGPHRFIRNQGPQRLLVAQAIQGDLHLPHHAFTRHLPAFLLGAIANTDQRAQAMT
ncbi:Uncharacterised protein [Klebsiella pneumoniae]|nr:Uncharacterised protein [Klebsiella pneumoniae]